MYVKLPILKNHAEQNLSSMSDALVSVLSRQIYTKNNFKWNVTHMSNWIWKYCCFNYMPTFHDIQPVRKLSLRFPSISTSASLWKKERKEGTQGRYMYKTWKQSAIFPEGQLTFAQIFECELNSTFPRISYRLAILSWLSCENINMKTECECEYVNFFSLYKITDTPHHQKNADELEMLAFRIEQIPFQVILSLTYAMLFTVFTILIWLA
jgi:hypothetical protein